MYNILIIGGNQKLAVLLNTYGYECVVLTEFDNVVGGFHLEPPHLVIPDRNLIASPQNRIDKRL